jgi:hypothetical protein
MLGRMSECPSFGVNGAWRPNSGSRSRRGGTFGLTRRRGSWQVLDAAQRSARGSVLTGRARGQERARRARRQAGVARIWRTVRVVLSQMRGPVSRR